MPTYKVTDPASGKTVSLTGDSPPTEQELEEIFSTIGGSKPAAPMPTAAPTVAPQETPQASLWDRAMSSMGAGDMQMATGGEALNDPQVMKSVSDKLPMAGMLAGGALGGIGGLGVGSVPIGIAGAGVGAGLGTKAKQWLQGQDTATPESRAEVGKEMLTGAVGQLGGVGIGWLAPKILAPAAGKIAGGTKTFINWAKEKGLPYSADIIGTWPSKIVQTIADHTGLGRLYTQHQRGKLVQGASEAARQIITDAGLPEGITQAMAGEGVATALKSATKNTFNEYNSALNAIKPTHNEILLDDTMQYLGELGGAEFGDKAIQYGIDKLAATVLAGQKKNAPLIAELRRISERGGTVDPRQLSNFMKTIWPKGKAFDALDITAREALTGLKTAVLGDLDRVMVPESGQTVGALRRAADASFKEMSDFFRATPLAGSFKNATGRKSEQLAYETFLEANATDAAALRDYLVSSGMKDQWDAMKAYYLDGVFKRTMKDSMDSGASTFQPAKYTEWFDKHGQNAMNLMPEHAESLKQWYDISKGLAKDFKRASKETNFTGMSNLGSVLTGLSGAASHGVGGPIAINSFSLLAALGTMGKGNLGFLRNYLMKETVGNVGQAAITGMSQGTKIGTMGLLDSLNAKQQPVQPLNLGNLQAQFSAQRNR